MLNMSFKNTKGEKENMLVTKIFYFFPNLKKRKKK